VRRASLIELDRSAEGVNRHRNSEDDVVVYANMESRRKYQDSLGESAERGKVASMSRKRPRV